MQPSLLRLFDLPLSARYMLVSSLGFALMGACVKAAGASGLPVLEIVAVRALISLVLSFIDIRRKRIPMLGQNRPLLMLRGVFGTIALIAVFYSVTTLPIAQAILLQYIHPTFTAVLALFFLKERINLGTVLCIVLSFIGLSLVTAPQWSAHSTTDISWLAIAAALTGAFTSACAYVVVRKLAQTEDPSVIVIYFPMVAAPISAVLLIAQQSFVVPTLYQLTLLVAIGVLVQIAQIALTKAMSVENAGKVSAYGYIQVVFAALLGMMFFDEIPTGWTLAGGVFIIAGAFINSWKKSLKSR
ncbi:Permease of the drug/metabolite transporter (DMT) superfamily [Marinobacterium lacunae]|uniref:Permease of the drug/metabolite transporter (DMT) superfamily n=1 Tax=Marinobacterium lacunae TaxID=1232683 RepID=A0A081G049_9GAMM|nr:DMT family transporter [Marinobacterium lacunae]KEA64154.1 Permease of the drug/metabolite transporter (DMT) superfamily [Marinobacterium lacunae]